MLAVPLPEAELRPSSRPRSVASINADDECVVAGPATTSPSCADSTIERGHAGTICRWPLRPQLAAGSDARGVPDVVRAVELSPAARSVSLEPHRHVDHRRAGDDPQYWVDHLRHTVRFSDCLRTVLADGSTGAGRARTRPLALLLRPPADPSSPTAAIPALRHPNQVVDDTAYTLNAFARAWAAGVDIDVDRFTGEGRRRVVLPGYAFRKERHWIEPGGAPLATGAVPVSTAAAPVAAAAVRREPVRIGDTADMFWAPAWVEAPATPPGSCPPGLGW